MGPAITELFCEEGATVIADERDLRSPAAAADAVREAGEVDVLIVNLIAPDPRIILEEETTEDLWQTMFNHGSSDVPALPRVLPQMRARRLGKIVVMGSANALRGTNSRSAYSAARGAQVYYVRSVGLEVAPDKVNVNLMAQFLVENPTSVPAGKLADLAFRLPEVPAGRMAKAGERLARTLPRERGERLHGWPGHPLRRRLGIAGPLLNRALQSSEKGKALRQGDDPFRHVAVGNMGRCRRHSLLRGSPHRARKLERTLEDMEAGVRSNEVERLY